MRFEHWTGGTSEIRVDTLIPEDTKDEQPDAADKLDLCCVIEGETREDCMQKYYDHNGWGEYKPIERSLEA